MEKRDLKKSHQKGKKMNNYFLRCDPPFFYYSPLFRKLEKEKKLLTKYIDKQYKDIMENFDPKIVRFRKKHKVIFHRDSGLDELLD